MFSIAARPAAVEDAEDLKRDFRNREELAAYLKIQFPSLASPDASSVPGGCDEIR